MYLLILNYNIRRLVPMKKKKLNNRAIDILEVLWDHTDSLSANNIAEISGISKNTVLPVVKKLLKEEYIKVDEVVLTGKTLTRKYVSAIDREEFILKYYDIEIDNLLNHFLSEENDPNAISKIEALINKQRKNLKNEEDK